MKTNLITLLILVASVASSCGQRSSDLLAEKIASLHKRYSETEVLKEDVHGFIVHHKGKRVGEHYYNGYAADSLNNIKSITKSITGLLILMLHEDGKIPSLDQKVVSYYQDCQQDSLFAEKSEITIHDLLMMQAGLQWNNRALIKDQWWFNTDPHCYLLNAFRMDTIPGRKFSYNSAVSHLLSGIVHKVTGERAEIYAKERLFEPLGITEYRWSMDQGVDNRGNSEIYLKPRDMAKIGEMLLHNGQYNGEQIIPAKWLQKIKTESVDGNRMMRFSYHWMIAKADGPYVLFAGGSGGQHIFIVPEKDLVVVTTGHWDNARSTLEIMQAAMNEVILK